MLAPSPLARAPAWHVLLTHPREERKAAASLIGHGIKIYLPEISHTRIRRGRRIPDYVEPMMPGYLFTPVAGEIPWGRIRATPGIRCQNSQSPALMINGAYAQVPFWAMQVIFEVESEELRGVKPPLALEIGQPIEVTDGPLAWFRGVVNDLCNLDTKGRLGVAMNLFGRLTKIELLASQVRAV